MPGEGTASVLEHVRHVVDDPRIGIRPLKREEPTGVSPTSSASFRTLAGTVRQIFPRAVVAPGLVIARTDSAHFLDLTEATYRFLPIVLTRDDLGRFHGTNERIAVDSYETLIKFYAQLLRNSSVAATP